MSDLHKSAEHKLPESGKHSSTATAEPDDAAANLTPTSPQNAPREVGGRKGLDPTRYGDWEKGGRCIDF